MSAAIAMAPSPAPHDRPSFGAELSAPPHPSAATSSPSAQRTAPVLPPFPSSATPNAHASRSGSGSPRGASATTTQKSSPPSASRNPTGGAPRIIVKKEPGSPDLATARHRPRKLDLSKNTSAGPATARPLTARESGGLGIQEVGLACLSPGFVTQDPIMKEQLQRSMSVREHQRQIIEQRLQQQSAKGDGPEHREKDSMGNFTARTPGLARKRGIPPGLSIVAPSHEQFAHERVIQSAPLGQTFTGRHNPHPLTRHITNQPSNLASTSHIHHVPANQTNNRLPPIADVFGQGLSGHPESSGHNLFASQSRGPLASPHHPPPPQQQQQQQQPQQQQPQQQPQQQHQPLHQQQPQHQQQQPQHQQQHQQAQTPGRPREYKSAEDAQAELAQGRPELLPNASKRRTRAEYEEGGSPPLGNGRPATRRGGPFGEGRDSPETQRAKREEFLQLCARAWDLFHS
ncbi:hypothetical protein B0T19DRAFT_440285 [Cercophora scortea]|uniref:Uncharacterized protein n=1 Tax=Cercophora scortea TaxID=314031 RepID=A0AAE0IZR5_9PEZI|nr:hypothetical protein B0T19DRAFT_440285 [Cercophora scortea]